MRSKPLIGLAMLGMAMPAGAQVDRPPRPDAVRALPSTLPTISPAALYWHRIVKFHIREGSTELGAPSYFFEDGHDWWAIVDGKYRYSIVQGIDATSKPLQLSMKVTVSTWKDGAWLPGFSGTLGVATDGSTTSATQGRITVDAKLLPKK